ncbi:MAG TPA: hypothetical protein VE549_05605 [Myxococcaceae bacterium]|nr:hypothetical protein [Myxococcaceae bacterium]
MALEESCSASTTEVRFNVKASGEEFSGTTTVVDGASGASWTHPAGTSGSEAHGISNVSFCDPSFTGTIKGTGKVQAGCVKIEGSQLGTSAPITVGGVTVIVTSWGSKDGEPDEYTSFSFVVCGTGTDVGGSDPGGTDPGGTDPGGTDPGGTDPGGTDPGGTDPGGSTGGEEPVN